MLLPILPAIPQSTRKISQNNSGPEFIPNLIKSCRDENEALLELTKFLNDPDQWYRTNHIPEESVALARKKSVRIRACSLRQKTMEVFDRPNTKLDQGNEDINA